MKLKFHIIIVLLIISLSYSCKKYLNQVPADVATLPDAFKTAASTYNFLASCYNYIPAINQPIAGSPDAWGSDEVAIPWNRTTYLSERLVKGQMGASNTLYNYWGSGGMYDAIRQCYTYLNNVNASPLSSAEKTRTTGEATFLIAYYHFVLLRQYGPIALINNVVNVSSTGSDFYPKRSPYDSCVNFIADLLDQAATNLPATVSSQNELGRATSIMTKALKARLLLYAASPLFNGNSEYYSNFKNNDGGQLMNLTYDGTKWQRAADACLDAINAAQSASVSLYTQAPVSSSDPATQALFNYRYSVVDPWNKELIWGYSNGGEPYYGYQRSAMPNVDGSGTVYNGISPTLAIVETYYTKNGLPINVDPSFNYTGRYQDSGSTLILHQNREPRFYASIAYNGGIYYCNASTPVMNFLAGQREGWTSGQNNYSPTGYLVQKMTHPNSIETQNTPNSPISYPWPIIRLSELYLSYAEALNEAQGTAMQSTVLQYINPIRARAGIPTVQQSWALVGKTSFTQDDLRQIIRTERLIELAFEGHRLWDIRRWKLGDAYLNKYVQGMNIQGTTKVSFYQVTNVEPRVFSTPASYLFPISTNDLSINKNLVQNPGW